jgi:hypothetical protein
LQMTHTHTLVCATGSSIQDFLLLSPRRPLDSRGEPLETSISPPPLPLRGRELLNGTGGRPSSPALARNLAKMNHSVFGEGGVASSGPGISEAAESLMRRSVSDWMTLQVPREGGWDGGDEGEREREKFIDNQ